MDVLPSELAEVISETPAMWPNWRSSGVATDEAMICALAPGKLAETEMVGKSTCGSGDTGSTVNAIAPAIAMAIVNNVVATGRRINSSEGFMTALRVELSRLPPGGYRSGRIFFPDCRRRCKSPAWYRAV